MCPSIPQAPTAPSFTSHTAKDKMRPAPTPSTSVNPKKKNLAPLQEAVISKKSRKNNNQDKHKIKQQ